MKKKLIKLTILIIFGIILLFPVSLNLKTWNELEINNLNREVQDETQLKPANAYFKINSPEEKIYTDSRAGDFPGTFSFDYDEDGSFPNGWIQSEYLSRTTIVSSKDGHYKVMRINDNDGKRITPRQEFSIEQTSGTVEFWTYFGASNLLQSTGIRLENGTGSILVNIFADGTNNDEWVYTNGTTNILTGLSAINEWFHLSIDFCSAGTYKGLSPKTYNFTIRGSDGSIYYESDIVYYLAYDLGNAKFLSITSWQNTVRETWIDAVGYSWDPNYNIGDNLKGGELLLNFEYYISLDWMGYSLDGQPNITIAGNTNIPTPDFGPHNIQISGIDWLGTVYKSDIVTFYISPMIIKTPEDKTYTDPMRGYYPAIFGFENDYNCSVPEKWTISEASSTSAQVISGLDGHEKVLELYDNNPGGSGLVKAYNNFTSSQNNGTIELWMQISDASQVGAFRVSNLDEVSALFAVELRGDHFQYYNGTTHEICSAISNEWYHLRIDFECTTGGYEGLKQYTCFIHVNDTKYGPYEFWNNENQATQFWVASASIESDYYIYYDAIGYSWNPFYEIGDNLDEGLLLSFKSKVNFDWMGYSLDGHSNRTILGNTTFSLPTDGAHSIQVFGNDSLGVMYKSDVREFLVKYIIINSPENATYCDQILEGHYPATYSFEDDVVGTDPDDWTVVENNPYTTINVISELDGHKKIVEMKDTSSSWGQRIYQSLSPSITNGTVEWWWRTTDSTKLMALIIEGNSGDVVHFGVHNDKFQYRLNSYSWNEVGVNAYDNMWYHCRVDFECTTGNYMGLSQYTWRVYINGTQYGDFGFFNNQDELNQINFDGSSSWEDYLIYVDAIGYSWDPNYMIGDNLLGGSFFTYEGKLAIVPESGYYPATYGFESDRNESIPDGWVDYSADETYFKIIPSKFGNNKVLEGYDNDIDDAFELRNYFDNYEGTIEFWWAISSVSTGINQRVLIFNSTDDLLFGISCDGGQISINFGTDIPGLTMTANTWDHVRLDYRSATGNSYEGLSQNEFKLIYNGTNKGTYSFYNNGDPDYIKIYSGATTNGFYGYYDAFGFSWDPYYDIGDNLKEGLLLSYENKTNMEWIGYSLDGQTNRTIKGNTTFSIPENDGLHSLQVFGNDSFGCKYESYIRWFMIDLNAPTSSISFVPHTGTDVVNQSTVFALHADDCLGSGVSIIRYKINNSDWINYYLPFTLSGYEYGNYTIYYYSIDKVGHIEEVDSILVQLEVIEPYYYGDDDDDGNGKKPKPPDYTIPMIIGIISTVSGIGVIYIFIRKSRTSKNIIS